MKRLFLGLILIACLILFIVFLRLGVLYLDFSVNPLKNDHHIPLSTTSQPVQNYQREGSPAPEPTQNLITLKGNIRKEKDDRELGLDYAYFLDFDEPFLLEENASGQPRFIDTIEIYRPQYETIPHEEYFNSYVGRHVIVAAELDWGYAESRIMRIYSIKAL